MGTKLAAGRSIRYCVTLIAVLLMGATACGGSHPMEHVSTQHYAPPAAPTATVPVATAGLHPTIRTVIDPFTNVGLKPGWSIDHSRSTMQVDCSGDTGSPYAIGISTHWCGANAGSTNACWTSPASSADLWCLNPVKPFGRTLWSIRAVHVNDDTPAAKHPQPLFIELADGSQWFARTGGAWSAGADGAIPVYGCLNKVGVCAGARFLHSVILTPAGSTDVSIDKSAPVWRVLVGPMGAAGKPLPKPVWMPVARVWFMAGHRWLAD